MAKNSITDYDNIANNNTDIQSVDIAEGCAPSGINNAIREMMADLADVNDGTVTLTSPKAATLEVTGDLTVDTNTLYVDSANNQVGIGVSSPNAKLDIQAPSSTSAFHIRGDATGNVANFRFYSADGATNYSLIRSSSSEYRINAVQSIPMTFFTNNTERMRIDSSGNVGIGTASPNYKLDVHAADLGATSGDTKDVLQLYSNVGGNASYLNFQKVRTSTGSSWTSAGTRIQQVIDVTPQGYIQFNGDGNDNGISFGRASSERMRINASGNVGIGTSSPSAKLTVSGTGVGAAIDWINTTASTGRSYRWVSLNNGTGFAIEDLTAGGSERMRIDASGNVGIGTSSPATQLHIQNLSGNSESILGQYGTGTRLQAGAYSNYTAIRAYNGTNDVLAFWTGSSERMRIDSGGRLLVGTTGNTTGGKVHVTSSTSTGLGIYNPANNGYACLYVRTDGTGNYLAYWNYQGSAVGSVTTNGSSAFYNTTSDYRLKENVVTITDGIERVKQLNPSRFNFIADADKTVDGFLAHEVQSIVPEAITGEKDAVDADGNPEYQGIDQSKLVPLLTAALQEAIAKIETLEARVAALEGN